MPYILAALVQGNLSNGEYNYRTFHTAIREKFPNHRIGKGFNWAEAVYNGIISEDYGGNIDITEAQIRRGRKLVADIKLRLLSATNPNIE